MESLRSKKRKPSHPGELLKELVLPELGITQAEFARRLQVSRQTVSELLRERRPLTADMAIRLARLVGGTPGGWLRMQQTVDLWAVEHSATKKQYAGIKKMCTSKERKVG